MESNSKFTGHPESSRINRWRSIVKEFEASGQSRNAYCEERGVKVHQLIYWVSRLKELTQRDLAKPPLTSQSFSPQTKASQETFTLAINGILVKVPKSTPSEKVISIIRCLI